MPEFCSSIRRDLSRENQVPVTVSAPEEKRKYKGRKQREVSLSRKRSRNPSLQATSRLEGAQGGVAQGRCQVFEVDHCPVTR